MRLLEILMISSFSDAGYLIRLRPHLRSSFLSSWFSSVRSDPFFQGTGLAASILHLVGGGGTCGVTDQAAFTGLYMNSFDQV